MKRRRKMMMMMKIDEQKLKLSHLKNTTEREIKGLNNRLIFLYKKLKMDLQKPLNGNVSILTQNINTMQYEITRDRQHLQQKYNDCKNLLENATDIEQKILLNMQLKKIDKSIELQEVALQQKKKNMQLKISERDSIIASYNNNFESIYAEIFEISGKTKSEILKEFDNENSMQKDIEKIEKEAEEATRQAVLKIEKDKESKKNRLLKMFKRGA